MLVQFGPPIAVAASAAPDAAATTTAALDAALRRLTINAPDWDTVRALDTVRRLYQPHEISIEDRIELARRFNTYYAAFAGEPRVVALMARVRAYQQQLDELGVTDRELARDLSRLDVARRALRHLALVLFWLPLCVPGAPLHLPTVVFARIAGRRLTPRKDVIATTKLVIGLALVLLSYAVAVGVLWWRAASAPRSSPPRCCRCRGGRRCACSIGCASCGARSACSAGGCASAARCASCARRASRWPPR